MAVVGYGSRWFCFAIISSVALSYVTNDMIYRYFANQNMMVWLGLNGLFLWLSLELAKWAVPDPPGSHNVSTRPQDNGRGRGGNDNYPVQQQ